MSTPTFDLLNLDAARREAGGPEYLTLTFRGREYRLPNELPLDVFDPLLADDFDITGLIREVVAATNADTTKGADGDGDDTWMRALDKVLFDRPRLPRELLDKLHEVMSSLFGPDEYDQFTAARPSAKDYRRIFTGLTRAYGVGLGEAFGSLTSSESGGQTPKAISPSSPGDPTSTSDESSGTPETSPASSVSAD